MALNEVFEHADKMSVVCSQPATPASGDPVLYGQRPGVALTDERADGTTSVKFSGCYRFPVKGIDGSGNSAVAVGDILYYVAGDTPHLSKKTAGVRFGYANEAVASGATAAEAEVIIGY